MTATIESRIARVVANVFGVAAESITPTTSQDTIDGWDSINHIHLIGALEAEFGVAIDLDEAIEMTSIAAITAAITRLVG
jgi:acyl carrier protein